MLSKLIGVIHTPTDQVLGTIKADERAFFTKRIVASKMRPRCSCGCDFLDNGVTSLIMANLSGIPGRMRGDDQKHVYN